MSEEDLPLPSPRMSARVEKANLDPLGLAELQRYIDELRAEISRAEAVIAAKHGHRSAADAFFRPAGA